MKDKTKLVPKKIRDKNGKLTTVWVKVGAVPKSKDGKKKTTSGKVVLSKVIAKTEKDILKETGNKYEACVALNDKGGSIITKSGDNNSIAFSKDEMAKMKGAKVFTHNHPSSRCFSIADIILGMKLGIRQIRAIATNSVKGNITWVLDLPSNLDNSDIQDFVRIYKLNDFLQYMAFQADIATNKMTVDEANTSHHYEVLQKTVDQINRSNGWSKKQINFDYEKRA